MRKQNWFALKIFLHFILQLHFQNKREQIEDELFTPNNSF
uniref:Uncharacterized protein n=1 Tax=Anguilla anguilla TaxID=7936 RepID=A0A0E9PR43_ANGAN